MPYGQRSTTWMIRNGSLLRAASSAAHFTAAMATGEPSVAATVDSAMAFSPTFPEPSISIGPWHRWFT
jgi:hypothetical protein